MVINDILKVLYAPHKVYKAIIQNPKYLGAFIVLLLFVAVQTGADYVYASKTYPEQTLPAADQGDVWTQNATLWQANSGVIITNNHVDFINSTPIISGSPPYFGSSSIKFAASSISNVNLNMSSFGGPVNCGADGFKNITLTVKLVTPDVKPENVTLYLYSVSDSNFFSYDLTSLISNGAVNVWNNITVPVGTGAWVSSNSAASWGKITSLKMDFVWPTDSNVDLRIGGVFFRGIFKTPLETYGNEVLLFNFALSYSTHFILQWLLFTALMYLLIKGLKGNALWKTLMVAVGFAFVTMVVQALILLVAYAQSPDLYLPLEALAGSADLNLVLSKTALGAINFLNLTQSVASVIVFVWTIALGAIITRSITAPVPAAEGTPVMSQQFGWMKSVLVSGASFLLMLLIVGFLGL